LACNGLSEGHTHQPSGLYQGQRAYLEVNIEASARDTMWAPLRPYMKFRAEALPVISFVISLVISFVISLVISFVISFLISHVIQTGRGVEGGARPPCVFMYFIII